MPLDFPVNPVEGSLFFVTAEKKYKYTNGAWRIYVNNAAGTEDPAYSWEFIKNKPVLITHLEMQNAIQSAVELAMANVALKSEIPVVTGFATKQQLTDLTGAGAPETLNQISEIAAAINNDPAYGANVLAAIANIPYDLADYIADKPAAGVVNAFVAAASIKFVVGMATSIATAAVAATASTTFTLSKNGVAFASFNFAAGATVATFTCTAETVLLKGDVVTITAPVADATLSGVRYTLSAKCV